MLLGVLRSSARAGVRHRMGERPGARSNCQISRTVYAPKTDGISQNIAYSGLWGAVTTFPKRQPYMTNIMIATVKTSLADLLVQMGEGKDIDWSRNAVFTAFGCFYLGCCQWFVYVTVFTKLCPNAIRFANLPMAQKLKDRAGQIDLVKQTFLDNFVHYTFIYFPVFYTFKEFIQSRDNKDPDAPNILQRAMAKYQNNFVQDNMAIWALWIPMDMLIYAVPIWMRLPLNHGVSLAWTMILSKMRGDEKTLAANEEQHDVKEKNQLTWQPEVNVAGN